jgi:hypothetical protein
MLAMPGFGGFVMKTISAAIAPATVLALALACDPPPPQGPQQLSYENGYPQTSQQAYAGQTTYQNGYPQQGAATASPPVTYTQTDSTPQSQPQEVGVQPQATATAATPTAPVHIQTTPVPLGVQALPPPTATTATPTAPTANKSMAVPGPGAFQCSSDAQCLLGRCNTQYGRCAYPCRSTENDCKAGNVCTAAGLCMPKAAAGVKM